MGTHELLPGYDFRAIRYERRPLRDARGRLVEGLYTAWIQLDNPAELNSYTTDAVREVILAFRRASEDPAVVAAVFTGTGDRAFCSGGNTREYATVYAGNPAGYRAYMRLFNDMVSAILLCDKPTICRVNGMRVGGGQEIGMACDFSIAQDLARFGQAGPKHGSAPDGGATDFLPLFVGSSARSRASRSASCGARTRRSASACSPRWCPRSASTGRSCRTRSWRRGAGSIRRRGASSTASRWRGTRSPPPRRCWRAGTIDLGPLDAAVDRLVARLAATMPDCMTRTLESLRKHKLEHWDRNKEGGRAWLSLNMMTEARMGFRAFHFKPGGAREIDFFALRRALASGRTWDEELLRDFGVDDASCRERGGDP